MRTYLLLCSMFIMGAGALPAEETSPVTAKAAALAVHVENGTKGGHIDEGMPVAVRVYQNDRLVKQASAVTDANGNCVIDDVPVGPDIVAVAQAKYGNMAFSSAPLKLPGGQGRYGLKIQVFDVIYDNSTIRVGTHHLIIKKNGQNAHITEYIQLVNNSDRAVLSKQKDSDERPKVIEIALPKNYKGLSFSSYFDPDAVVQTRTGFYDTMAVPPGAYNAVFSYDVPLSEKAIDISKRITFPTKTMMVFIQADAGITSDLGAPAGQMALTDGTNTNYYTVAVSPGSVLTFHAEGITIPGSRKDTWLVLEIVFAVVILVVLFRLVKLKTKARKGIA